MIEKLDLIKHTDNLYDKNGFIANVACGGVVISKVNELIDAVNELQLVKDVMFNRIDMLNNAICDIRNATENTTISKKEKIEPADPYEEQRKWLGKLCKFWDGNEQMSHLCWGILYTITPTSPVPYCCSLGDGITSDYEHCEPVLPTDSIIYKGGDNE